MADEWIEFWEQFSDSGDCFRWLAEEWASRGWACPKCGSTEPFYNSVNFKSGPRARCQDCRATASFTSVSVFKNARKDNLLSWFKALKWYLEGCAGQHGVSGAALHRYIGGNLNPAQSMLKRFRNSKAEQLEYLVNENDPAEIHAELSNFIFG